MKALLALSLTLMFYISVTPSSGNVQFADTKQYFVKFYNPYVYHYLFLAFFYQCNEISKVKPYLLLIYFFLKENCTTELRS